MRPADIQRQLAALRAGGHSEQAIDDCADSLIHAEVFLNDLYQVIRKPLTAPDDSLPMVSLSIRRIDRQPVHDWRHLQEIKNLLVGPECEAVEVYPAESRLVDSANQYWLWCVVDPAFRFPFGFSARLVSGPDEATAVGATQRAFEGAP